MSGRSALPALPTALLLATSASLPAAAQVLPSRQELNPAQLAPLPAAPRGELFREMEAGPCGFRDSALRVRLTEVEFRGAGPLALAPGELALTYADLIGREMPISVACDIRDRAAALYLRRGVLAAVAIPEQRISGGKLVLQVTEARVASVRYSGDVGPAQRQVARYLDKLQGLAPFDLDVAQRYLLLASDVPGVRVQATLRQSPAGNGAVDLDIAIARIPVNGALSAQNHGSPPIGRVLGMARVDYNSFTALGERTSIVGYGTIGSREQRVIQVTERVNLGGEGLAFEASAAFARTRPGDVLAPLGLLGDSFAGSARLSYPILRHRRHNLTATGGIDWIDQKVDFGGGIATLTEDKLRVLFARLDGHLAPRGLADHSVAATGSIELRKGLAGLGASPFGSLLASRFGGRPDATVIRAEVALGGRVAGPLVATIAAGWQYTDSPLLSYEEFSAGNLSVGRGYDPSTAAGDRVAHGSFELTTVPLRLGERVTARPYGFVDIVRLTNIGPGADRTPLRSAGLGVRAQLGPLIALDAAWAVPLDSPVPLGPKPPERLLVTFSASIF